MKPSVKIGLGIFTSLATIGFIFFYDFYIKDRIDSVEVVVVKNGAEILKSERLTSDKLIIERRAKDTLVKGAVLASDLDNIIGVDTRQDLIGNSIVSEKMLDYDDLIPDITEGEAIRPITEDMIFAQPGSLRRKDVIDIYLVNADGSTNLTQSGPSEVSSESASEGETAETADIIDTQSEKMGTKPFLKNVKVVYVKDSGNKEVVAAEEGNNGDKRLNATSTISDLEVILNEEDFAKLVTEVLNKGAKLYITYQ